MSSVIHKTIPMQVWADIDVGIADMVAYLNTIPGVRTLHSCQGTIGEGGPEPYRPEVLVTWPNDGHTFERIESEFDISYPRDPGWTKEKCWATIHPKLKPEG